MIDQPHVDRDVRILLEWLGEDCASAHEMVLVLARALTVWLEAIPVEERPRTLQALWLALDQAIEAIELAYGDVVLEAPLSLRH